MHCDTKQTEISKSFTYHPNSLSIFHLRQSSINISRSLPYRHSSLPIRIQYEFRTTLKAVALLSIGQRFKQELIDQRILTNLDNKTILSTFFDDHDHWMMISLEVFHLWIDVRIGKNALSQRFYVSNASLAALIQQQVLFGGDENYSGCVRNIEITYSQLYSILLNDQLVETNENRTLGCERYARRVSARCISILFLLERMPVTVPRVDRMSSVKIIGSIIRVYAEGRFSVNIVMKVSFVSLWDVSSELLFISSCSHRDFRSNKCC